MLDLAFVREHLPLVEEKLRQRGMNPAEVLKDFPEIDARRRQAITEAETLKAQRNKASEQIAQLKKNKQDATALIEETKQAREKIAEFEKNAEAAEAAMREILLNIPNIPHESVPVGKSADDNVEVRRWGTKPSFDFTPKPHWELGEQLGILDLERAAKISGARFAVYWDLGARLERALMNFMLDLHTQGAWIHRGSAAVPGECRVLVRHWATCRSSKPTCSAFRMANGTFTSYRRPRCR